MHEEDMEEERVKKGGKGKPNALSDSGSESEREEMKMAVDSKNEDKSSTAEKTAKDDGQQEEVEEEEEEEEEEESDEEEEDDEEEEEESDDDDDDDDIGVNKKRSKKIAILESESSDDGEGDDCPICLNRLKYQDIGTPEACDHNFCLDCIQLWARNVNTCPVDRREFQLILARHAKEDDIFKRIPVSGKSLQNEDDDTDVNEDFTYCELCGRSDREDRLLLCDGCDLGFHCECLDPPLDSVPVEEWFCPDCAEANTQRSGRMLNDLDDDMQYLLEENPIDGIPYLRPRRRQIARTRISERVRARIQEYREGLARLVCDDEPGVSEEEGEGPSTRLSRTRSQTRQSGAKRKPARRKRTKKGRAGKQKAYPKKKLRRRTKTPGKAQIFEKLRTANASKSPKSRLAGKLGLTKARASLRKSDRVTAAQIVKEDLFGPKPLTITGGRHDLDPFPDDDTYTRSDEPQASTSVFSAAAAKRASKYSASALLSRQPVARPLLCKLPEDNPGSNIFSGHCSNSGSSSSGGGGGLDLLGSIMMEQNMLNLECKDVKINRDGSLTAKKVVAPSAVKEPKNKKFHLFVDSKDDENSSSVHMDSDNERSSDDSKVAASTEERPSTSGRNDDSGSQAEDDNKKEISDPKEKESMESDTDVKCSDAEEMRDSDNETKPSTVESGNEMPVSANKDDDGGDDARDEKKDDDDNADDSFESNEADKSVEKENENEDGSSPDELTEVGHDSQNSEMNDEHVSPDKERADRANSEEEEEEEEEGCKVGDEEEDEDACKDEQKDDNMSEHKEEESEMQQEEKSGSEHELSMCSPVGKTNDADPHSDEEPASLQKDREEEFLSDEENGGKDTSMSVEKLDDSVEISENTQDDQNAASDADNTEDDVAGKEDADSVKSDAEEAAKDVDETDPISDGEDKDAGMAKSDAEDLEAETAVKSDTEAVKSDTEDLEAETAVKSDAEDLEAETAVKSDTENLDPETGVKSDAEDMDPETAVKSDTEDLEAETAVKSDAEDLDPNTAVKSDTEDLEAETAVKSDAEDIDPETAVKSDAEDVDPETAVKSDTEDLETEEREDETSLLVKSDEEEDAQEDAEVGDDVNEDDDDDDNSQERMQDEMLPSEEFPKGDESDDGDENGENATAENLADEIYDDKDGQFEVADEASENCDDAASKDSDGMVKTHEELETFEEPNEVGDEGSESGRDSPANEEEDELQEKPKIPISELPRIPKRSRREGYRRERGSRGDGPELKSVLGRVDLPEYKMGRSWEKKDSRRNRWEPDEWNQSERDVDVSGSRDKKSEVGKGYHSDHSESSKASSEKYTFEYKESKSRKRRRDRSRSRSRGHKDIPHRHHSSPERSKSRRRDRSRNRSRSGSREKSFDYDKSHKRKGRGRSRDRSQSRKSRRHRSYSRSPSRKRDKERSSTDKRRHREERKRGEERGHKRHSDKSDPEESRKKRHVHEDYDEWEEATCQVVEFDDSTSSPKGAAGKKSAECFYGSPSSNEKVNENFFNRRTVHEKSAFKGDKMEESGLYNARGSSKKNRFVDRFYKAPHLRHTGTEKFPIDLSEEEDGDEHTGRSRSSRVEDSGRDRDPTDQDSGDSEYDPAFPTESGSPLRGKSSRRGRKPSEEAAAPVAAITAAPTAKTSGATVKTPAVADEIASSGSVDETPPAGSQGILGESGFMMSENPNMQNMQQMQPQNVSFPMGIRMMPPGMQQHLLMNPMFLNRPPPFGRLPRMSGPMGRLGWSVNPSGIMQIPPNRFGHARMGPGGGGGMPPRPGLLNGGFEGMPQEPGGQQMPPFKQHPCDPRNIPSHNTAGHQGPPGQIPRHHMPHLPPPGHLLPHPPPPPPTSEGQPSSNDKSAHSNFCVPELNQISKLIEAHAQALQNKQRNPGSQGSDIDVFKIPLPPMAPPSIPPPSLGLPIVPPPESHTYTSTSKSYKNGQSRLLGHPHSLTELVSESTEVVDMDVASPLDDEVAIELPASPELDDIDESKINMKDSAVIELTVPEDVPASAVELTNLNIKEKHPSRVKKGNRKASQQQTASPTSTKTSYMGYMKKLQIQERVVDEVKLAIKPFYSGKKIDKDEYKEILRKAVPKICHSKSGNINPAKIKALIEAYVDKMCKTRRYMERKKKLSLKANGERLKKPSR